MINPEIDVQSSEIFSLYYFCFNQKSCMSICQTQIKILGCERLTPMQHKACLKNWYQGEYCLKVSIKLYFWCINSYWSLIS